MSCSRISSPVLLAIWGGGINACSCNWVFMKLTLLSPVLYWFINTQSKVFENKRLDVWLIVFVKMPQILVFLMSPHWLPCLPGEGGGYQKSTYVSCLCLYVYVENFVNLRCLWFQLTNHSSARSVERASGPSAIKLFTSVIYKCS
jgi:hypothetical protein